MKSKLFGNAEIRFTVSTEVFEDAVATFEKAQERLIEIRDELHERNEKRQTKKNVEAIEALNDEYDELLTLAVKPVKASYLRELLLKVNAEAIAEAT